MAFDMVSLQRGQVWKIRFRNKTQSGHEQLKDRPWLILSIGKFNQSSGMATAVPITSRSNTVSPAQVLFQNDKNSPNVILCEQIRTFDLRSGNYDYEYIGVLSEQVLERVDVALSIHLGLHYSPITLKKLYDSMEAIIKSVGYMQDKTQSPKFTDEDVLNFANKLEEIAVSKESSEKPPRKKSSPISYEPYIKRAPRPAIPQATEEPPLEIIGGSFLQRVDNKSDKDLLNPVLPNNFDKIIKQNQSSEITPSKSTKKPEKKSLPRSSTRIEWTIENCNQFLKDADELPMKDVMMKWHILTKPRFYSMKKYVKDRMEKMR